MAWPLFITFAATHCNVCSLMFKMSFNTLLQVFEIPYFSEISKVKMYCRNEIQGSLEGGGGVNNSKSNDNQ